MKALLVDYARLYRAGRNLGIRDILRPLFKLAQRQEVTDIYFWAFSYKGKKNLSDLLVKIPVDARASSAEIHCSVIALEALSGPPPPAMVGHIDIGGTQNATTLRLQNRNDEVDFDVRLAYAIGSLGTREDCESITVVSNSTELLACLSDVADHRVKTTISFFGPEIGAPFYRALSQFSDPDIPFVDLLNYVKTASIRGCSIDDTNFRKI